MPCMTLKPGFAVNNLPFIQAVMGVPPAVAVKIQCHLCPGLWLGKRITGNIAKTYQLFFSIKLAVWRIFLCLFNHAFGGGKRAVRDDLTPQGICAENLRVFHRLINRLSKKLLYLVNIFSCNLFTHPGLFPLLYLSQFLIIIAEGGKRNVCSPTQHGNPQDKDG